MVLLKTGVMSNFVHFIFSGQWSKISKGWGNDNPPQNIHVTTKKFGSTLVVTISSEWMLLEYIGIVRLSLTF